MDYNRKSVIYDQLCQCHGRNLMSRTNSATSRLIESLANSLREDIHKIEENGVFAILRGA